MAVAYDIGDEIRIVGVLADADGDLFDPDGVVVKYKKPSGSSVTLTYGVDAALVRESEGRYSVDLDITESGTWFYRFSSTGTGQAADEGEFYVDPSSF